MHQEPSMNAANRLVAWSPSERCRSRLLIGLIMLAVGHSTIQGADKDESSQMIRFLRVSGSKFVKETEIHLSRSKVGIVVKSITQPGKQTLTVTSKFDSKNVLISATATLRQGKRLQSAAVSVMDGTARVRRDGHKTIKLACPVGVIVTSAPDWTDSIMAVRRWDPKGGTTQKFPALWIHPTREPLELTLKLTRLGHDSVTLSNKSVKLDRFLLVLRAGSKYVVWRNQQGQLVRLVPAKNGIGGIVLAGWELATRDPKPRMSRD